MGTQAGTIAARPGKRSAFAAYMLAHGGKSLFWVASDLYFTFYMNEVCGIAPIVTGLVVGFSLLVAAIADETFGRMLGARVTTAAQAGRLQLGGGMASAVALLTFASVAFVPTALRVPASIATLLLFRLTYAAIDVPQNALLTLAASSGGDRTALVAGRNVVGGMARITLSFLFIPVLALQPPAAAATRFFGLAAAVASSAILGSVVLAWVLHRRLAAGVAQPATGDAAATRRLALWMFVASTGTTGFVQLEPYLATYGLITNTAGSSFITAVAVGTVASQPFWRLRALRTPGRILSEALLAMTAVAAIFPFMPLWGTIGAVIGGLLYGIVSGGLMFALWSLLALTAAGPMTLAAHGRFSAAAKCGQGISTIAMGVILQFLRDEALIHLGTVLAWLMAGVLIVTIVVLTFLSRRSRKEWTSAPD